MYSIPSLRMCIFKLKTCISIQKMYISRLEIKKMSVLPHISSLHFSFNQPERKTETGLAGMHMTPEKYKDKKDKKAQGTPSASDGFPCAFLSLRQPESEVTHRH